MRRKKTNKTISLNFNGLTYTAHCLLSVHMKWQTNCIQVIRKNDFNSTEDAEEDERKSKIKLIQITIYFTI